MSVSFTRFVWAERQTASITHQTSPRSATFWFAGADRLADSCRLVRRARLARFPTTVLPSPGPLVIVVRA